MLLFVCCLQNGKHAQRSSLLTLNTDILGRMLPVLVLVVPTVMYGLLRYVLTVLVRGAASRIMRFSYRRGQEVQVRSCHIIFSVRKDSVDRHLSFD